MAREPRSLLVTNALPYANGDIHLGHLVEAVQTDIFVRYHRLRGNRPVYVCADDTHGTPIELNALKQGITCEELIAESWKKHVADYQGFDISFDIFYTTNSPENRRYAELIYAELRRTDLVVEKEIEQYYCTHDKRFLPDRFIQGECPKCGAADQYGDVCEVCGAAYASAELKNPVCIICKNPPELRRSTHFFVTLEKCESFLREYLQDGRVLQDDMRNFVMQWIDDGLRQWCISRDGPYFGFEIPGAPGKYFYVWLDAPIGYLSSTDKWCSEHNEDVTRFWGAESDSELVHFIGKDIVYFHALFWPVMLDAASFKLPDKIYVHGFLTVEGEKMSKSRGTFIRAREFLDKVSHPDAAEYLRFYYAAKLSNHTGDIDLNFTEFCSRVNTTLANNIGNLHHRTCVFIDRYFNSVIPDAPWDESLAARVEEVGAELEQHFDNVEYRAIVEKIQALGSSGNKYYQDSKPWELVKSDPAAAARVMTTCANLLRALAVFLKPIVPAIAGRIETQFGSAFHWDDYHFSLKNHPLKKAEKLVRPIERTEFDTLCAPAESGTAGTDTADESLVTVDDFFRTTLRIGEIRSAEPVKKSDKLLKLAVYDGSRERQIIAGIAKHYSPAECVGKRVVFVANLKPARLMGELSEGMVLAATKGKKLTLIRPEADLPAGAKVS